jgi:hypothetical protein
MVMLPMIETKKLSLIDAFHISVERALRRCDLRRLDCDTCTLECPISEIVPRVTAPSTEAVSVDEVD